MSGQLAPCRRDPISTRPAADHVIPPPSLSEALPSTSQTAPGDVIPLVPPWRRMDVAAFFSRYTTEEEVEREARSPGAVIPRRHMSPGPRPCPPLQGFLQGRRLSAQWLPVPLSTTCTHARDILAVKCNKYIRKF